MGQCPSSLRHKNMVCFCFLFWLTRAWGLWGPSWTNKISFLWMVKSKRLSWSLRCHEHAEANKSICKVEEGRGRDTTWGKRRQRQQRKKQKDSGHRDKDHRESRRGGRGKQALFCFWSQTLGVYVLCLRLSQRHWLFWKNYWIDRDRQKGRQTEGQVGGHEGIENGISFTCLSQGAWEDKWFGTRWMIQHSSNTPLPHPRHLSYSRGFVDSCQI